MSWAWYPIIGAFALWAYWPRLIEHIKGDTDDNSNDLRSTDE